mgnify:CR=1 FL=1
MKKLLAAAAAITLLIGVPTAAEACRRWSEPRTPIPTAASDTGPSSDGLGIGGVLTCSTATVTATYPDGPVTLTVTRNGAVAETITGDGTSSEVVVDVADQSNETIVDRVAAARAARSASLPTVRADV